MVANRIKKAFIIKNILVRKT